jgi:hypothetical protein
MLVGQGVQDQYSNFDTITNSVAFLRPQNPWVILCGCKLYAVEPNDKFICWPINTI